MKIIDDFLPNHQFNQLESGMMDWRFPWYYTDKIVNEGEDLFQFIHIFYERKLMYYEKENTNNSSYMEERHKNFVYPLIEYCVEKLGVKELLRIKANLRPRTSSNIPSPYHTDYPNATTSIFYLNSNNGYTKFKKGDKVNSVANRMITFNSNLEHQGVSCSDQKRRIVINYNYYA